MTFWKGELPTSESCKTSKEKCVVLQETPSDKPFQKCQRDFIIGFVKLDFWIKYFLFKTSLDYKWNKKVTASWVLD